MNNKKYIVLVIILYIIVIILSVLLVLNLRKQKDIVISDKNIENTKIDKNQIEINDGKSIENFNNNSSNNNTLDFESNINEFLR